MSGELPPAALAIYRLSGLRQGQTLYAYAATTSGNLDPILAILDGGTDLASFKASFQADIEQAASSADPAAAINEVRDRFFLAWNDDGGEGYAAALEFQIPQDGDYYLGVAGAFSSLGRGTFGGYKLLVGLDAPQVLGGQATSSGEPFAARDASAFPPGVKVEEVQGEIITERPLQRYPLQDLHPGDTLYVYVEATSGDLAPVLILRDYGDKPLSAANLAGTETSASLQAKFDETSKNILLEVTGENTAGEYTQGAYRLLVGVNAPDVLTGEAETGGGAVLRQPIEVQIGVKLQQIIQVNENDEFFQVVGSMQMEWNDPALAFSPDTCQCRTKVYTEKEFDRFLADVQGQWPDFTLFNQQGNRWVQNRVVVLEPDGHAIYFERFSTNLQTDFDFRKYPFDTQNFLIRVDLIYPQEYYFFTDLPGYSEISQEHGEDEFIITGFNTEITSVQSSIRSNVSRFTFGYQAPRHLNYYILQIFVPILLIVLISWWTFFLKDYSKRIEIAAGNILLFIAFSFSLAGNYPHLGYMTFLDAVMAMIFIVNALVLIYNVYMRRLEMAEKSDRVERIDNVMDWAYPLIYLIALGVVYVFFFVLPPSA
jgi:hypothetical protein